MQSTRAVRATLTFTSAELSVIRAALMRFGVLTDDKLMSTSDAEARALFLARSDLIDSLCERIVSAHRQAKA